MPKAKVAIRVRETTRNDIPALIELNRAAYPRLANENVVWGESHLRSHLRVFPQGQLVAEGGGRILGAVSSLLVDMGPDPLRHHTWAGITDSGYFTNHNPKRDLIRGRSATNPTCPRHPEPAEAANHPRSHRVPDLSFSWQWALEHRTSNSL